MNHSVQTPCRKVGLSRKKTTQKNIEILLNKTSTNTNTSVPINSTTPENNFNKSVKKIDKPVQNNEISCRQVGLSRKKKSLTPRNQIKSKKPNRHQTLPVAIQITASKTENLVETFQNIEKPEELVKNLVCTTSNDSSGIGITEGDSLSLRSEGNERKDSVFLNETLNKSSQPNEFNDLNTNLNCNIDQRVLDQSIIDDDKIYKNESHFIKVCYKTGSVEKLSQNSKIENKKESFPITKSKFNHKILNVDDDDFDSSPKKRKKRNIQRSKTDTISETQKSKSKHKKLKKSVTDISLSSEKSFTDCFIKLENMKNLSQITNKIKSFQDLSDDDFDIPSKHIENVNKTVLKDQTNADLSKED